MWPTPRKQNTLIFYQNVAEAYTVSQVKHGVCDQIIFLLKILIFMPSAINGPNFITWTLFLRGMRAAQKQGNYFFLFQLNW